MNKDKSGEVAGWAGLSIVVYFFCLGNARLYNKMYPFIVKKIKAYDERIKAKSNK